MQTILLCFVITLLAMLGLAIGILLGRAPLRGSCGGIACLKGISCSACKAGRTKERP